ncbi:c-type cytochrome domain-containing protein [Zobellia uliginosa]|uniref:c-type cytochrome domain-containing protein n=1 Tax=Zobellia uliginosa TaxID=143224 RepID=UPI0026E3A065|nr:c-type cytochrome domain-containing protein [Zobellia uliginosa]MDO6515585.1 c-type cytochrome domain-containing protein [Zobellia uliginosa]
MTDILKKRWVDYTILGLSVFLVFCLVFDAYIVLPNLVAWLGRWHPLVLHFPIVLLLIAAFLGLTGRPIPHRLLVIAVLSALLTAISGFFLGKEAAVKGDLLFWHQWMGGAVALMASVWYLLSDRGLDRTVYGKGLQVVLIVLVGFTGHYGGMVTHGEEFLALPTSKKQKEIPENPIVYTDVVARILDDKCVSCHNANKKKGELLMTNMAELLEGGKSGHTIVPGEPLKSELIGRLHLPLENEEHMPPEGKTPLTDAEIKILERWVALGASDTLRFDQLPKSEPLVALIKGLMEPDPMSKWADLPFVADSTLQNLGSDYLTIERVASNSNALSVDVYLPPEYDAAAVVAMERIAGHIVELDLSGLPIGAAEMDFVAKCQNLEWLEIDKTPIGDGELEKLASLKNLKFLKTYATSITDKSIPVFENMKGLKNLYVYQTGISREALENLQTKNPTLSVNYGIDPEIEAFFVAGDSVVVAK